MRVLRSRLAMVCTLAVGLGAAAHAQFIDAKLDYRVTTVGKIRQVITNMGTFDKGRTRFPGLINAEFPPGSDEEHLFQGGIWIGGITPTGDTLVSMSEAHFTPHEFYATKNNWDSIWTGSKGDTLQIPYWQNYECISDQDFVSRYSDDNVLNIDNHTPLHLDIIQSTYSWSSGQLAEFLLHKYYIINKKQPLKDVYIGFWMHSSIGNIGAADNYIDEYTRYYRDYKMAVAEDSPGGSDGGAVSPIAFSVMTPNNAPTYSFNYYEHEELPIKDAACYQAMASARIMPDRIERARAHIILGFGPFQVAVGETLKVDMAEIFGVGLQGLLKNAAYLTFLKSKNFRVPAPPPKPILRVATTNHEVSLDWRPLSNATNPELYTDTNRGDTVTKPFEGYRLYKSTKGPDGPWTLLAEYDVINDEGYNTGLQYTYKDQGLLNNIEYYYGLTAFSKSDKVINFPSQETSVSANAATVVPGTAPPATVGEVAAVPNPYRGDIAYNSYNPPWERPQGNRPWWMEQDRRIQFINLPTQCQIKIYTLAGDLVATLDHHDATRGYEDWNLTSSIGQAISSGIYLFTVEDVANAKVQVGKFVIIK
ncbi:MAG: hypothetical protein IPI01_11710 [Ignavibacteriae bacterium]|nr:hypothetical protein [Ignavibacteriota bacterium]